MECLLSLIEENLGGKADRKKIEKTKYIRTLKSLLSLVNSEVIQGGN